MKILPFYYLFIALLLTACAENTAVKPAEPQHQGMTHNSKPVKKGICADLTAPPLNKCANTVTSTFDSHGKLWIAWVYNEVIYVQSSTDQGKNFSPPVAVNLIPENVAADKESRPKMKVDDKGIIYLTWSLMLDKKRNSYVRFSRSTDGGVHFSTPVTVNDNREVIRHRFDSLAIGKNGEVFVAWNDARDNKEALPGGEKFKGLTLYYSYSKDGGEHFVPNRRVAMHTCECCRIETGIASDNTPVILWRHIFEGSIRDHALVKFSDWDTPGDIHHVGHENWKIDACPHHGPSLAIADNGGFHAVWFSGSDTSKGLFYANSTDEGKNFSRPVNFGGDTGSHPHVLALGQQVAVVWQEYDGTNNAVKVMLSGDGGKTFAEPKIIAKSKEAVDLPFLVSDGKNIYVSWQVQQRDFVLMPVQ